ncbi:MAG TPA: tetrahydromethanopterin S-methyltransferase subunit H [Methanocorpusculum sp.]|jgi:tetrahydromethanopterin S-methyltransferase subunit H|nr:tetrahydromethanopterin S-methyltransferase subunit H [Methanocorpusculum sp.]MBR4285597.1 tetrahydromethanopterin S-methyltransferase subunit H [Methanocorpusculum sp.]MBR5008136.1 tetrahydromethanopterin S-methyltransferase subunit H [Methanocorpusculum sp.]MBR5451258.1 tetrahydromethanopterin S-methyltransferase subunit H [Methanocorpusculum sp.]MEE1136278.1 tetrahydromethanopterin S-methyltransferase subunit H [Methanocorpusculum sp.]
MFKFEKEQQVFDFNGTKIGGQPGEYPRVMSPSIFYNKHEIVLNDHTGEIDKAKAEALWNRCQELTDITGNKFFLQILAEHGEAFESYFNWFDSIDSKTAFLMDSSAPEALVHATKYVTEVGLADRAIYNSINGSILPENIQALKESDVNSAIVLAFNPGEPTVAGREKVLTEGGVAGQEKGMLQIAEECGITRPILDSAATPLGLGAAGSMREILACKAIHGLPTGGAYHNMTVSWTWLKRWRKNVLADGYKGKDLLFEQMAHHHFGGMEGIRQTAWSSADVGCNIMAMTLGADLIMYGPIENMEGAATAAAFCDIVMAEAFQDFGGTPAVTDGPINKLI